MIAICLGVAHTARAQETWTTIPSLATSDNTGEKPQSKVWFHGHTWWAVLPTTAVSPTGTWLFKLNASNVWTPVMRVSSLKGRADTKAIGNVTHVLVAGASQSVLVSLEYVPAAQTYQLWSERPTETIVYVGETGTIDVDSTQRMWLATESGTNVEVYYSDFPYSSFFGPVYLASDTDSGDINAVIALPNNTIGVFWSNFALQRFGFRVHQDGTDPTVWLADETPAAAAHPNKEMADDHLNLTIGADGTLYAVVKAGHASASVPLIYLLVRHPQAGGGPGGTWDNTLYPVSSSGTRPIVTLNEEAQKLRVFLSASGGIYMHESARWPISFGAGQLVMSGSDNNPTTLKDRWAGRLVVLASSSGTNGVLITTTPGLVGHWTMEEGSGTQLRDMSGWGNHGTFVGSPSWTTVAGGKVMHFDGSTHGAVSDQAQLNPTGALSLAAWVKPEIFANQDLISRATVGSVDGYSLSLASSGKVYVHFDEASFGNTYRLESTSTYPSSGNTWMHVAATYDGTTMRLYVNGVEENWVGGPPSLPVNTLIVGVGGQGNGSRRFRGDMDDARIYNRSLTPAEVAALNANGPMKADLVVTKTDSVTTVYRGLSTISYAINVTNLGPSGVSSATISDVVSSKLTGVTWTCFATGGATCSASGSGSINDAVTLPAGASLSYTLNATVAASATGTLTNTASIIAPGVSDPVPGNNSATDVDNIEQAVAPTINTPPANVTVTQPNSAQFSVSASGTAPLSYQWRRNGVNISGATSSTYVLTPTAGSDTGAQFTVVVTNIAGSVTSAAGTLTVNVTPSITTPPANVTVTAPASATFTVVAAGTAPLSYQWRRNGVNISGATNASYVLNPTGGSDNGAQFSVVVSNVAGSVTSAAATLTVNLAPSITSQPANLTVTAPASATFSVAAAGTAPISYQWRRNFSIISGATGASYVLNPTAVSDSGAMFDVIVTNPGGGITSAAATLTVNGAPVAPSITTPPASVTVTAPASATFSVVAAGTAPLSYQWRRNGANISGATGASYVLNPTAGTDTGATFDVVVSNVAGSVTSAAATLTVNAGGGGPSGPIFDVHFDTTADGFVYQDDLFRGTDQPNYASGAYVGSGGFTGGALRVGIGGVNSQNIANMSGGWRRSFTLPAAAPLTLTFRHRLTEQPTYETDEFSQTVVSLDGVLFGVAPNDYIAQVVGGGPVSTGWQLVQLNLGTVAAGTHVLALGGYNNQKTYPDETVEILVDDVLLAIPEAPTPPGITTPPANATVTAPASATFSVVAAGTAPLSYQWRRNGANIIGATGTSYVLNPTAGADTGATFDVVVTNSAGSVTSGAATLTVNVTPSITTPPANFTVTAPAPATFSVVAAGTAPFSYQWRRNGANISGATGASYVLDPTAGSDSGSTFDVVVTNVAGSVTSAAATLSVNTAPIAPSITTPPASVTVTAPAPATFSVVAAGTAPFNYQWRRNGANIGGATGTSYVLNPTAGSDTGATFDVVVSNAAGSVTSAAATLTVNGGGGPSGPIFDVYFDATADGFGYQDDVFRATEEPDYATGAHVVSGGFTGGGLQVVIGAVDGSNTDEMSGAWQRSFSIGSAAPATLWFRYKLSVVELRSSRFGQVLVGLDGVLKGVGSDDYVAQLLGGLGGVTATTGWQQAQIDLGTLSAGTHVLALGGFLSTKSHSDEYAEILIDDVVLISGTPAAPSLTTAPANVTVSAPAAATFSVVAAGTAPLSYQWRRNGANISGATGTSYVLNPTAGSDSGSTFDVVVTNVAGSITSAAATLTVNTAPVAPSITTPPANATVIAPNGATFSVVAAGTAPLSYQWRRNGADISGATGPSYVLNPTAGTDTGATFDVVVSNVAGSVTSVAATLTVHVTPSITTPPANVTVTAPASAAFSVVAAGTAPLTYQWRRNGANISGATGASYVLNPTASSDGGSTFDVVVTNVAGSITSAAATLTVDTAPVAPSITTPPANATVTAPNGATFAVVAAGTAPLSYQWRRNGADIVGATGTSYVFTPTAGSDSGSTFDVVVSNGAGSVTSAAGTLTVNVTPTITTPPAGTTVTAPASATFSVVAAGTAPLSYQWRRNGANISGATAASYVLNPTGGSDNGATFEVVVSNVAGSVTSAAATLTVNATPSITTPPANVTVTAPGSATFSVVAAGTAPLSYQWRRNGANVSGATNASYVLNPTSESDTGATFDVVVSNVAGSVTSAAGTLTVNVTPSITTPPANVTVTAPASATFSVVAAGTPPLSYQWRRNGANISGATGTSYVLDPTAGSDGGATFDVVVSNVAGSVTSAAATLTVNAPPSITTPPANATVTAPNGATFSVVAAGTAPLSYQWRRNGTDISGATNSSYVFTPTAGSDSGSTFDVVVTNSIGSITSAAGTLTVNVAPSITTPPANMTVTSPASATFSVVAAGTAPLSYQWRRNGANISGATNASYVLNPTAGSDSGSTFDVVVTNSAGSVTSAVATLTVNVAPTITTPPANVTVTAPASATFVVAAAGTAPLSYQWRRNGANISGATGSSYVLNPTAESDSGSTFDVIVTNSVGSVTSAAATLTVNAGGALFEAHFDASADSFGYADDLFRNTAQAPYATGAHLGAGGFAGGGLQVLLGGVDGGNKPNISGGWQRSFTKASAGVVTLTFRYKLSMINSRTDRFGEVLVSINGVLVGIPPNAYVAQLAGTGGGGTSTTEWQQVQVNLGTLPAGAHSLALGGYLTRKSNNSEFAEVLIDDVVVTEGQ